MIDLIINTWITGGWIMLPIAILAVIMYSVGIYLILNIKVKNILNVSDKKILEWIDAPSESPKEVRYIFEYIFDSLNIDDKCKEIEIYLTNKIDKHLSILIVLVASAPLLGLLGTVTGMILTFQGISLGGVVSASISKGISEALITTETGLLVAIPGIIATYWIKTKKSELITFLLRVESIALRKYNKEYIDMAH
jgi:biopolymer transport protein ExbB